MTCPTWPLDTQYKVVNFDGQLTAGVNLIFFGPRGVANVNLAWVVFALTFSYNSPVVASGFVTAFYQSNSSPQERSIAKRVTACRFPTDSQLTFPVVGGASSLDSITAGPGSIFKGRERPLYLPWPDEFIIGFTGAPAGRDYQLRGLVLEVTKDMDVSMFL